MNIILNNREKLRLKVLELELCNKIKEKEINALEKTIIEMKNYVEELEKEKGADEWHQ